MDGEVAVALDLISTWIGHTSDSEARHWVARAILVAFPNERVADELPNAAAFNAVFPLLKDLAKATDGRQLDLAGRRRKEPLLALAATVADLGFVETADWEARRLLFHALVELLAFDPQLASSRHLCQVAGALRIEIEELAANPTSRPAIPSFRSVWETIEWFGQQGRRYTDAAARAWQNHLRQHLRVALASPGPTLPWSVMAEDDLPEVSVIPSMVAIDTETQGEDGESLEPTAYWLMANDGSEARSTNSGTPHAKIIGATQSTYVPLRRFSEYSATYLTHRYATEEAIAALAIATDACDPHSRESSLARALCLATSTPVDALPRLRWGSPTTTPSAPFPGRLALDGRWLYRPQLCPVDRDAQPPSWVHVPIPPRLASALLATCGPSAEDDVVFQRLGNGAVGVESPSPASAASATQLQRALLSRLMKLSRYGPSAAQLVAGDDLGIDLAPLHYDQIPALDLALQVSQVTFPWFADRPGHLGEQVPNHVLGSARVPSSVAIARMLESFRDDWKNSPQQLFDRIHHRTRNLIHGLCLTTGHRPNNRFHLLTRHDIGVDDAIAMLSDKVAGADWSTRPVALAERWVLEYRALLSDLAAATASDSAAFALACHRALAGEGPVFLARDTEDEVRPFDRAAYLEGAPDGFVAVPNFARHFLNNELAKALPEPLRVAQMGWHGSREGAFADGSPWSVLTAAQDIAPVLDRLLKTVGWRPLEPVTSVAAQPRPVRSWRRAERLHQLRFRTLRSKMRTAATQRRVELQQSLTLQLVHLLGPGGFGAGVGLHYVDGELTTTAPDKGPVPVPAQWSESLIRVLGGDPRSASSHAARALIRDLLISGRARQVLTGPLPRASLERWPSHAGPFVSGSADAIGCAREWDAVIADAPASYALKTLSTVLLHGSYADLDAVVAVMHPGASLSTLKSAAGVFLVEPALNPMPQDETVSGGWLQGTLAFHGLAAVALDYWHRADPQALDLPHLDAELQVVLGARLQLDRRRKPLAALMELAALARVANALRMDGVARLIGTGAVRLTSAPIGRVVSLLDDLPMGARSDALARPPRPLPSGAEPSRAHRVHDLLRQLKEALSAAVEKRNRDRRKEHGARSVLVRQIRQWLPDSSAYRAEEVIALFALVLLTRGGRRRPSLELSTIRGYVSEVSGPLVRWLPAEPMNADADAWTQAYLRAVAEVPVSQRPARAHAIANFHWVLSQAMGIPDADLGAIFGLAGRSTAMADAGFLTRAERAALRYVLMQNRLGAEAEGGDAEVTRHARSLEWLTQVMAAGGLRPGEACRLLFDQLPRPTDDCLRLARSRYQRLKNANARRRVRCLTGPLLQDLSEWEEFSRHRAFALGSQYHDGLPVLGTRDDPTRCVPDADWLVPLAGLLRWVTGEQDARPYWLRKSGVQERLAQLMAGHARSLWATRDLLVEIGHEDIRTTLAAYTHDAVTPFLRWFKSHWVSLDVPRLQRATGRSRSTISRDAGKHRIRQAHGSGDRRLSQLLRSNTLDPEKGIGAIAFPIHDHPVGDLRIEDLSAILSKMTRGMPLQEAADQHDWSAALTTKLKAGLMRLAEWDVGISPNATTLRRCLRPTRALAASQALRQSLWEAESSRGLRQLFDCWLQCTAFDGKANRLVCSAIEWEVLSVGLAKIPGLRWSLSQRPGRHVSATILGTEDVSDRHVWQLLLWAGMCAWLLGQIVEHRGSCTAHFDGLASALP